MISDLFFLLTCPQSLQTPLCPYSIAPLKKMCGMGHKWLMYWQDQEVEISFLAASKCAFVHAQDTSVLTECGRKGELFSHTHLFPCGRSSSKENSLWQVSFSRNHYLWAAHGERCSRPSSSFWDWQVSLLALLSANKGRATGRER